MKNNVLELKNVTKKYSKSNVILDDMTYSFKDKTFYIIKGKSGIGKSTIIKILGTLLNPTKGKIIINDKDTSDMSSNEKAEIRNKKIGFVFQDFKLNKYMTALENIMLPMYLIEKDKNVIKEKAISLLEKFDIIDLKDRYPKELSGGEQQRIAIIRAIINNPDIILADEPTGSLDPENEEIIMDMLKQMSEEGKCVIVVSHSKSINNYANQILVIKDKKLVEHHEK